MILIYVKNPLPTGRGFLFEFENGSLDQPVKEYPL